MILLSDAMPQAGHDAIALMMPIAIDS